MSIPSWLARATLVLALLLPATPSTAQRDPAAPASSLPRHTLPRELDVLIEKAMAQADVPGLAVAIVQGAQPPILKGYGVRRRGGSERVDSDTLFNIASLTKTFTSGAAAVLVDEGRLKWDDPVRKWLPQVEFADPWITREVTLRDLLSHRTGIDADDTSWMFTGFDRAELIRRLRYMPSQAPFRTRQLYANVPYMLGGEVAAAAAESSWEELVRTRLLQPLGMRATGFGPPRGLNVASPHARLDGRVRPIRHVDYTNIGPSGSMHSTAADMSRWMRLQLARGMAGERRLISEAAIAEMREPQVIIPTTAGMRSARHVRFFAAYGLGWNIMDYRGRPLIWHSGSAEGMPSYMALLPAEGIAVLVMANSSEASALRGVVAERIIDLLIGAPLAEVTRPIPSPRRNDASPPAKPAGRPRAPLALAAYAGSYASALYGDVRVETAGDKLSVQIGRGQKGDLVHSTGDVFGLVWRDPYYSGAYPSSASFQVGADGLPAALTLILDGESVQAPRNKPSG